MSEEELRKQTVQIKKAVIDQINKANLESFLVRRIDINPEETTVEYFDEKTKTTHTITCSNYNSVEEFRTEK